MIDGVLLCQEKAYDTPDTVDEWQTLATTNEQGSIPSSVTFVDP